MQIFYRSIVLGLLVLQASWFFIPWGFAYENGAEAALSWLGANSLISHQVTIIISNIVTAIYIVTYFGLIFFQNWARNSLLLISIIGGVSISLYGLSIQSGYEAMLSYFMTLGDGVIIAISYFTSINLKFQGVKAGH